MKLSLRKLVAVILITTAISCTKEPLTGPSFTNVQTEDNATNKIAGHYIGERFGGGIIFFLSTNDMHGLIADTIDLPNTVFGTFITTGATLTGMQGGPSNTRKNILAQGTSGNYAALECAQSKRCGYTDWFLPSKDELNELYKQKNVVGGFADSNYWSSTEYSYDVAWYQLFNFGLQGYSYKYYTLYVRAIRAF